MVMTTDVYWAACTYAGDWRRGYLPRGINLLSASPAFPRLRKGIYIVSDRTGKIAYVGRVCRPTDAVAVQSRTNEHVTDVMKAETWAKLHVVPLRRDTPDVVVSYLEAELIAFLQPYQNRTRPDVAHLARLVEALAA